MIFAQIEVTLCLIQVHDLSGQGDDGTVIAPAGGEWYFRSSQSGSRQNGAVHGAAGRIRRWGGIYRSGCLCVAGYNYTSGIHCMACPPGYFKDKWSTGICELCPSGKYSDQPAATVCLDCPQNTVPYNVTSCACDKGFTLNGTACVPCAAGSYKGVTGSDVCTLCNGGTYSSALAASNGSTCLACPSDSSSLPGSENTTDCKCNAAYTGPDGGPCTPSLSHWDCTTSDQLKMPIVVYGQGPVHTLNVSAGSYSWLFSVSNAEVSTLTACGISPIDSYAYCAASAGVSNQTNQLRLIRFGSSHADPNSAYFEYVAVLPNPGGFCTGGAFAPNGDFHYYCQTSKKLYVLRPDGLPGFPPGQSDNPGLQDWSGVSDAGVNLSPSPYDLALVKLGAYTYGFTFRRKNQQTMPLIRAYRTSDMKMREYGTVLREGSREISSSEVWLLTWAYGTKVMAAHKDGAGVYQIDTSDFDIDDNSVTEMTIEYIGPSAKNEGNGKRQP